MIHGRNLIVSLDGVAIAGAKSCDLDISQDFLKACSPIEGRVMDKVPTTYDWGVSVACLIPSSTLSVSLEDKLIEGTKCLLTFTDGSGNNRAGWVYVKSCKEGGNVGSLATFSASFESTGALYKFTMFEAQQFDEGYYLGITAGTTGVTYDFQASGTSTYGVEITAAKAGKLVIFAGGTWALVNDTFSEVKIMVENELGDRLSSATIAWTGQVLNISAGTYTFLVDEHSANKKVMLLQ